MSLKRVLYSILLYLISPLVVIRLLWRSRLNPNYRKRISERFGFVGRQALPIIWLHAVSVGETNAATPLIEGLIKAYPDHRILITTTTPTGSNRVKSLFSNRVAHYYFPYDLPDVVSRFLKRVNPQILIVVETEIWPNLFSSCHKKNIPVVLVNARLSEKSTKAYLKIEGLINETLKKVESIAVRSQADAVSFKKLGAVDEQVTITGNIKFDFEIDNNQIEKGLKWKREWGNERPVLVAASTHEGEEEILLEIYSKLQKNIDNLLLILVPRHPERFDDVYQTCIKWHKSGGVSFITLLHSKMASYKVSDTGFDKQSNIIIGDSMGEMQSWFAAADVVFIGGSLVDIGGHNPIEAIAQSKPVVSGSYMFNFRDIVPELTELDLLTVCNCHEELLEKLKGLLASENKDIKLKSQKTMQQHRGATARLLTLISGLLINS